MIPLEDSFLIDELNRKYADHDTTNFIVSDFLGPFGSPVDAVMYLRMFWPRFIRFECMVFREETLENDDDRQRVRDALSRYAGDLTKTEQSFNLVEVPSGIFNWKASEGGDQLVEFLAEKLVELWSHGLVAAFPDEKFVVQGLSAEEIGGGEAGLTFYMCRSAA